MTTRSWTGGQGRFADRNAWTPAGTPDAGDTLFIGTGTAIATHQALSGLTIDLQQRPGSTPATSPPELDLRGSTIRADTSITLGGTFWDGSSPTTATIDTHGTVLNRGTIAATRFIGLGPNGQASALAIDVHGRLINAGTIASTVTGFALASSVTVQGGCGDSLINQGLVESDGTVKLDIDVIGHGTLGFGKPFSVSTIGPPTGPTMELTQAVGRGQSVDFAAEGADSHGTLLLDDADDFHGLIRNFVASTGNVGALHTDRIVLQGLDVTGFAYHGNAAGGVLTLQSGGDPAAHLRFAGSYATASFDVLHPDASTSIIELKS